MRAALRQTTREIVDPATFHNNLINHMITTFVAIVVGVMEVSPGICQMELLNPDGTINTSEVKCEYIVEGYEPAGGLVR